MGSYEEPGADIIDIQSDAEKIELSKDTVESLKTEPSSFSSLLLWNEHGLKRFEAVTYAQEYYLTNCEIELLKLHSHEIADKIEPGSIIVELGSGCLRKTKILLQALDDAKKPVDYFALDLSRAELERTLKDVALGAFEHVRCHGLLGTYDDGLVWLQQHDIASRPRVVLSLGSTLGSFTRPEAAEFLRGFATAIDHAVNGAIRSEPLMIIGVDGCKSAERVWPAYNDTDARNDRFIRNALDHANQILGKDIFHQDEWDRRGEWNEERGRHEQYLVPRKDIWFEGRCLKAGEKIFVVASHKYDDTDREELWKGAGLRLVDGWQVPETKYGKPRSCSRDDTLTSIQGYIFCQREGQVLVDTQTKEHHTLAGPQHVSGYVALCMCVAET
jgi:EasF-like predicted methyltransferase